jgi:hypothetical protein
MSYSISARGDTKDAALKSVHDQLHNMVGQQPIHSKDLDHAIRAARSMVDVLDDDDTKDVRVSVSGSLAWNGKEGYEKITSANVSVSAGLWDKNPPVAKGAAGAEHTDETHVSDDADNAPSDGNQ